MAVTIIDVGCAMWFIFPAYCANAAPVIFGGGPPVDFGKIFLDGKPILGSHKTLRGFLSGLLVGTLVGSIQTLLFQHVLFQYGDQFRYDVFLFSLAVSPPSLFTILIILITTPPIHFLTNLLAGLLGIKRKNQDK